MCLSIMVGPAGSIIQGIYTRDLGLKLGDIATYIIIARLFDALTDPAIGYLSDATKSVRWGRKPLLVLGTVISIIGISRLYFPPHGVTPLYFFTAFVTSFLGWTLVEIPHMAWGTDITRTYDERSRIFSFRFGATFTGLFLFLAIPLLSSLYFHFARGQAFAEISLEYSRNTLHVAFWIVAVALPIAIALAALAVPTGLRPGLADGTQHRVGRLIRAFRRNKPFHAFSLIMAMYGLATGMQMGIAYLHLSSYLQLANWASIIYVVCLPLNVLSTPIWLWAATRWGKHKAFASGGAMLAVLFVALGFLSPGPWALPAYFVIFGLVQCIQAVWYALPPAILSDVSDYGSLQSREDNTGSYFAVFVFLMKCTQGLGAGIGFAITAACGFDPAVNAQSAGAALSLKLIMGFIPAVMVVLASWLVLHFPITRARHDVIRRRLTRTSRSAPDRSIGSQIKVPVTSA
jgi:Na+/melibiose symporter-like transporter